MKIGALLKEYRDKNGLSMQEFADKSGLSKGYISMLESGRHPQNNREIIPSIETVQKIAAVMGLTVDEFLESVDNNQLIDISHKSESRRNAKGISIPILGSIAAGVPIDAIEDIIGYEDVPLEMAKTGTIYGLRVKGHSMEPRIWEGDIVILRWQSDVDSGDVAAVLINGEDVTLKKIHKGEQGITLIALNPSVYEPHFYTNREIQDLPVAVVGKVLEVRGTL